MIRFRFALTALLAVAFFCVAPQTLASDAFTVSNVHVDANGYSASVAQGVAFAQGRPRAWQIIYRRLTRRQDWDKQPQLDDTQLQRLIRNFKVTNERRSTTRYTADITYNFNPAAVARILRDSNIAFAQGSAHRILLVPMNPQYARGSAWTNAFIAPRFADAIVPFSLPLSDAIDAGALAHLNFESGSWMEIANVALRVHATEAVFVLLQTEPRQHKLAITVKRVGVGETPMQSNAEISYVQTAPSTYPAAADQAMSLIAELWKERAAVDFGQRGTITVDVRVASLSQWASVQSELATVPNVTGTRVLAMDIGEARMTLNFLGTIDQLHEALSQAGLQLGNSNPPTNTGEWTLHPGPPSSTVQPPPAGKPPPAGARP
jgi:hypothetical protein